MKYNLDQYQIIIDEIYFFLKWFIDCKYNIKKIAQNLKKLNGFTNDFRDFFLDKNESELKMSLFTKGNDKLS